MLKPKRGLIPMSVIFIKDYLNELTRIYEEADTLINKTSGVLCKIGCSVCCQNMSVQIWHLEAANMVKSLNKYYEPDKLSRVISESINYQK